MNMLPAQTTQIDAITTLSHLRIVDHSLIIQIDSVYDSNMI